jgi:hypothetical protein
MSTVKLQRIWQEYHNEYCRTISSMVCMEMPAWVPVVSEGGWNFLRTETDIADQPCCGRLRVRHTGQLLGKRGNDKLAMFRRKTMSCALWKSLKKKTVIHQHDSARPHTAVWPWKQKERLGTAISSTLQSGHGPLRLPLVLALEKSSYRSPLQDKTDEAVQEAMWSWLWGAGTDFYCRGIFKILQCWQKCIDWDKDFVCISSFHSRINVPHNTQL